MTIERAEENLPTTTLKINSNTYINLATVVLMLLATLWIKDGQYAAQSASKDALVTASQVARDSVTSLQNYKALQDQSTAITNNKIDELTKLVKDNGNTFLTKSEDKQHWIEFQALNSQLKFPPQQ